MIAAAHRTEGPARKDARLAAIRKLAASEQPEQQDLLRRCSMSDEADEDVRREAQQSLRAIDGRLALGAMRSASPSPA